ncbi:ATP-binding protein [Natrinema longum]|uniref:ATP-binding protein n=1 Tax=Natrinema longum TaxID=370324 RepID=A0A8A2U8A1_9EURY|nr:ATP-binding protein [Natrinema longum]MBZ6493608.1 ATP-binding protein [Natrinema longum]QSW85049.1 ATP-binding protein [Natrinema longum]
MGFVIGRGADAATEQAGHVGRYRALDGSQGTKLYLDLDGPHATLIVGKRGYGKSFTMGVVAEELARAAGVTPVVIDPMGVFSTLAEPADGEAVPVEVVDEPAVSADVLGPRSWCSLLGLSAETGAGALVWEAAQQHPTLADMRRHVEQSDAPDTDRRSAVNHIDLADTWGVFDPDGLDASTLASTEITVVDVSGLDSAPMNAVCRGIAEALYRARVDDRIDRLPWLLIDEAHTFFDGIAEDALHTVLTRGRAPGVSLVLATQRPSAVSEIAISQSDVLVSHRLTAGADLEALNAAQPTYMNDSFDERLPTDPGEVVVIDDATETIHAAQIRARDTPHGGGSPSARELADHE